MGVRDVLKADPFEVATSLLESDGEFVRRKLQKDRYGLLFDDVETIINDEIDRVHNDPEVRSRMKAIGHLCAAQAPFKRTCRENAKPIYIVPAIRDVEPESEQEPWAQMAQEIHLNETMDAGLLRMIAANHSFIVTGHIERLDKAIARIIPAHCMWVITDPDDPCAALAYGYDTQVYSPEKRQHVTHTIWWDDTITWQLDEDKKPYGNSREHNWPLIPIVAIHKNYKRDSYWDVTEGQDLVAADLQAKVLELWKLRKLKAQGFGQLVAEQQGAGSSNSMPKGQTLDPENILQAGGGVTLKNLATETNADNFIEAQAAVVGTAAADHGISRARLNQEKAEASDDTGLLEFRAEMMKVMYRAEMDMFRVMQAVSRRYKDEKRRISDKAKLFYLDFGEIQQRVDRLTQLETRKEERSMGLRSWLDDIMEDHPECMGDRERAKEIGLQHMKEEADFVEERRALNIPEDASVDEPGQDAAANGAMGPAVRDGKQSRDDAAVQAKKGPKRKRG